MYPDIVDLREFYESEAGQFTRRQIRESCRRLWPSVSGDSLLGLGYTTPYMRPFLQDAERALAFMPAQQGVTWWPREGPNATALVDETQLPVPDLSVDRIMLAHCLENSEQLGNVLQECWRVLRPQGRMIVIVPNRSGIFARDAGSPFGYGFSFSLAHLRRVLTHNRFQLERHDHAVFVPPWALRITGASTDWFERQGRRFLPALAGVLLVETTKQMARLPVREKVRVARSSLLAMPKLVSPTTSRGDAS